MRRQVLGDGNQRRGALGHVDLDPAEPGGVRPGLSDQYAADAQPFLEDVVRVCAEDQVDVPRKLPGEHVVCLLPVPGIEAHVREQHHELRALPPEAGRNR